MNGFMRLVSLTAAIGGALYGYDTGIISGALLSITDEFKLGHTEQEMVASAILLGAVGAALAPSPLLLGLARVVLGIAVGGSSQAVPTYIAELAPAARRGALVTAFNVAIGVGIMVASLVGYFLHGMWSWRWMVGIAALPATVLLVSMIFLPETPRWLASKDRQDDARAALRRVRAEGADIEAEMKTIQKVTDETRGAKTRGWRGMAAHWVRPAVICGLGVAAFTQLSGIEMMIYYAPTILKGAGFGGDSPLLSSMGIAAVYLVMTVVGLLVVDRVGRRRLSLCMIPGAALALLVLGACFMLGMTHGSQAWALVGCLLVYMAFNSGGLQVVGWLTGSEVYPLSVRGAGTSAQAGMVWGADLIVTVTALTLVESIGTSGTMWVYAGMNVLAFLFIWFLVPETAGHSLEEIEDALKQDRFRPARGRHPDRELAQAAERRPPASETTQAHA